MKAGQSQEKKKEKVTTLLPTMSESKLCVKRGGEGGRRERERGGEREGRREKRESGIMVCFKNRLFMYIVLPFS